MFIIWTKHNNALQWFPNQNMWYSGTQSRLHKMQGQIREVRALVINIKIITYCTPIIWTFWP